MKNTQQSIINVLMFVHKTKQPSIISDGQGTTPLVFKQTQKLSLSRQMIRILISSLNIRFGVKFTFFLN
jgi:hypothetical protein